MSGKSLGSLFHNLTTSLTTPPASPNQTIAKTSSTNQSHHNSNSNSSAYNGSFRSSRNSSSSSLDSLQHSSAQQQQIGEFSFENKICGTYQIKYVGSTALRRRHTLPMLNWIVTDLICQSRCDGEELHVAIRNCLQKNASFEHLKTKLGDDNTAEHGLNVVLNIVKHGQKDIQMQIQNSADEQLLLCHSTRQIFLFGRHSRESNVFFYVHKETFEHDKDRSRPMLFVFQAQNDSQLVDISTKYTDLRPVLCLPSHDDKHLLLNVERSSGLGSSNCFEVLHVGTMAISQKRASPSMVDGTVEEFRRKLKEDFGTKQQRQQYRTKRFLVEVIEENENELESSPRNSLISNTQSLDHETRNSLLREFNQKRRQLTRTPSSENVKNQELTLSNKTMLLLIGQLDICLISLESHKTVLSKTFSNISHCSQGVAHSDHFAIIVREPFAASQGSTDAYVAHIFQCQTEAIVNELLSGLRQAFSNAYKASKMRQSSMPISSNDVIVNEGAAGSEPYCDNCPMNWFHQLCLDTDGLDNDTIFVLLMFRIEQYSSDEKRQEFYSILEAIDLKNIATKVDVLMTLLKARAERMQMKHENAGCRLSSMTIYDQITGASQDSQRNSSKSHNEVDSSQSSLTRIGGLKLMAAKSSIANTLESLFKPKNIGSTDNLQNLGSPMLPKSPLPSDIFQRRNTVADCSEIIPEDAAVSGHSASSKPANHPRKAEKCHSLNRQEQKSLLNMFMKVSGSQTKLNSLEEFSANFKKLERQESQQSDLRSPTALTPTEASKARCQRSGSIKSQMRHRLYKRICKSIREYEALQANQLAPSIAEHPLSESPSESTQDWHSSAEEHLHRTLNDDLKKQEAKQSDCFIKMPINERVTYDVIKSDEKEDDELNLLWDKLIESFKNSPLTDDELATTRKQVARAVHYGVPRERKNEIWHFLASVRKGDSFWAAESSNSRRFRDLLGGLTTQQHAILVDLGRTFPNVPFFAHSMGEGQLGLFNLLKAYSLHDTEVEYCQGLSFVAGILLLHMDENVAFEMMCYVLFDCGARDQYKPDMAALQMQMYQMSRLLSDRNPLLHDHLERWDVQPTLYAAPCFLTLFASQFPIPFVSRVFDFLILHGLEAVFRILFCMLDRISGDILSREGFESIVECIRDQFAAFTHEDFVAIFSRVGQLDDSVQRSLDQYRLEYAILQEEFAHLSQTTVEILDETLESTALKSPSITRIDTTDHENENRIIRSENLKLKRENESLRKMVQKLQNKIQLLEEGRSFGSTAEVSRTSSSELSDNCFVLANDAPSTTIVVTPSTSSSPNSDPNNNTHPSPTHPVL